MSQSNRPELRPVLTLALQGLLLVASASYLAWLSWGQWCDPLIDFGVQLYLPWRVAEGEILYRDLDYYPGMKGSH
jgi:hypothetical protein